MLRSKRLLLSAIVLSTQSLFAALPAPTASDVPYGEHPRQKLDFYQAVSASPAPAVIYLHGGGWIQGDKQDIQKRNFDTLLDAGISVVSINYRYVTQAQEAGVFPPVSWPLEDIERALQFVSSQSEEWNLAPDRLAAAGTSAGACSSLYLALSSNDSLPHTERLWCVAVHDAQTSLDPRQMVEWTPNSRYGQHAFSIPREQDGKRIKSSFTDFLQQRSTLLPEIRRYSPFAHASSDDPSVFLLYNNPPNFGNAQEDPTHSANFGVALKRRLQELGVPCELSYPGAPDSQHNSLESYLITELKRPLRIAMAGDSTMSDYALDRPDRGWGMYVDTLFEEGTVTVTNFAKPGRSTKTFMQEGIWTKLKASRPDYVFIQFGHNDSHEPHLPESTDADRDYRSYLVQYIQEARAIGAKPILVTPMVRRTFNDDSTLKDNLRPYAESMEAIAKQTATPIIDLHSASWALIEPLGPSEAQRYANKPKDPTHFNETGAKAMAKLVADALPSDLPSQSPLLRILK